MVSAPRTRHTSALLTSDFPFIPALAGLPGSEVSSLTSEMLGRLSLALLPRCWNWTFRRDFAIVERAPFFNKVSTTMAYR